MMNAHAWSVFHDGEISSVSGNIPGDLEFIIVADYLREEFAEAGVAFKIHVTKCEMLSFKSFTSNETISGIDALAGQDLEILTAKLDDDVLLVTMTGGQLRMRYQSEALSLDSGCAVQISDIAAAAERVVSDLKNPGEPKSDNDG